MFHFVLFLGLTCLMASTEVTGEAEADAQFFYNPYPSYWHQPVYYYPSYQYHPVYYYPKTTVKAVKAPEVQKKQPLRQIVPVFDYLRSGTPQVSYLRPDEIKTPVAQPSNEKNIVTYSLPYTQAYLNRVPATRFA